MGFEPMRGLSPPKRLAGARTRPLCDPSKFIFDCQLYGRDDAWAINLIVKYGTNRTSVTIFVNI